MPRADPGRHRPLRLAPGRIPGRPAACLRPPGETGFPFERRYLFLENCEYPSFDLGGEERIRVGVPLSAAVGEAILIGDTPAELIGEYTGYAGRMRPLPHWILSGAVVGMRGGARGPRRARSPARARRRLLAAGLGKAEAEEFRYAAVVELGTGQRTLPGLGPARRRPAAGRREGRDPREPLPRGPLGEGEPPAQLAR